MGAMDENTDAVFGSEQEALNHDASRFHCFNDGKEFVVYLEPKNLDLVGVAGTEVSVPAKRSSWIPTTATTIPHYGLRCHLSNLFGGTQIRIMMEMKVAFKHLKH